MSITKSRIGWAIIEGDSHISQWVEDTGKLSHDEFLIPLACSHINEGDCVIDCGANIGSHTYAYSQKVGPKGAVVAIEPGRLAFDCLMHNTGLFPFKNVMPLKAALSDLDGQTVKHEPVANAGASTCVPVKDEDRKEGESYLLTVSLDFIASQIQRPVHFMKLDIEGWEVDALIGASKILQHMRPTLLIEVNQGALEKQGAKVQDLIDVLLLHKYYWIIVQPQCDINSEQFDILCTPTEKANSQ